MMRWYLANRRKPDVAPSRRDVALGVLCSADSDGYSQGFEGVRIAHDILANGAKPGTYPPVTPTRGPLLVNRQRAQMLGMTVPADVKIDEYIEQGMALQEPPVPTPS